MQNTHKTLCNLSLLVLMSLFSVTLGYSQSKIKVDVDKPSFEDLKSPDFGGTNSKKWDKKDWLEIEVGFEVSDVLPKGALFVDRLTVKWYIAAQNPDPKSKGYILLEKEVEHINIPVGEKVFSSVYLSPSAVMRFSGGERASKTVIDRVGGEILYNGERVGFFSSKEKAGWWQSGALSRYDKIPLRSKNETPFHYYWWDRYAENRVDRR